MTDPARTVRIMGILNLNGDSFYAPSRYNMSVMDAGPDIVDIGAVSTRPEPARFLKRTSGRGSSLSCGRLTPASPCR